MIDFHDTLFEDASSLKLSSPNNKISTDSRIKVLKAKPMLSLRRVLGKSIELLVGSSIGNLEHSKVVVGTVLFSKTDIDAPLGVNGHAIKQNIFQVCIIKCLCRGNNLTANLHLNNDRILVVHQKQVLLIF